MSVQETRIPVAETTSAFKPTGVDTCLECEVLDPPLNKSLLGKKDKEDP